MNTKLTPTEKRKAESLLHEKIKKAIDVLCFRLSQKVIETENNPPKPPKRIMELFNAYEKARKEIKRLEKEQEKLNKTAKSLGWALLHLRYNGGAPRAENFGPYPLQKPITKNDGFSLEFLNSLGGKYAGPQIQDILLDEAHIVDEKVRALVAMKAEASERIYISGDAQEDYKDFADKIAAMLR